MPSVGFKSLIYPEGVLLNTHSTMVTSSQGSLRLKATVLPVNASCQKVTWISSNPSIATVDSSGLVTYVSEGECTITCTTDIGGYTDSCTITCKKHFYINFLLVGGGGGGSQYYGGGGGGGGVIQCNDYEIEVGNYPIVIGSGGSGIISYCDGVNGGNSTFNGLTAYGGGGGGGYSSRKGRDGGSGGGAGYNYNVPGVGCCGQGYNGGCNYGNGSGGGGGAGSAGCNGASQCYGGLGGDGISSDITGSAQYYSPGGSGHSGYNCSQSGNNTGGAGSGLRAESNATCYGGGGGGVSAYNASYGKGMQGIFVISYPANSGYNITGGEKYLCKGRCIHCFTSSGDLVIS